MALMQEDMIVAEYHARFLTLKRFAPWSFQTERQRADRFVRGLRLSLHTLVSMFQCATLKGTVARTLEGKMGQSVQLSSEAETP